MANTRFQLEGNAAELFEQYAVPMLARPIAELTFEHVSLRESEQILDVACGTGIVTRVAVERFTNIGGIVGVDLNPSMLEVARANTPETDIPITWREGDVCALPFPDDSFDVALCQQGLQFVPDKLAALREVRRVLVSGGRLAFTVFSTVSPLVDVMADALRRHVSAEAATSCLSPFVFRDVATIRKLVSDADFHAIDMQELEFLTRRPSSVASIVEGMARMPFARDVAAVSEGARLAMGQEVVDALQAYRDGTELIIPYTFHLLTARTT
jgi:ubiquinone/menaquinone biosynthesis C-methylase UbiE